MPNDQPVIISKTMMFRAFADPQFMLQVPEFRLMKAKLNTMKVDITSEQGCSGCKQRRVEQNLYPEFLNMLGNMAPDSLRRLKQYFGVTRIMLNLLNRASGQVEMKIV